MQPAHADWLRKVLGTEEPLSTNAVAAIALWAAECWDGALVKPLHHELQLLIPELKLIEVKANTELCTRGHTAAGAYLLVDGALEGAPDSGKGAVVVGAEQLVSPAEVQPVWSGLVSASTDCTLLYIPREQWLLRAEAAHQRVVQVQRWVQSMEGSSLCGDWDEAATRELCGSCVQITVPAGSRIINQYEAASFVYLLLAGRVKVVAKVAQAHKTGHRSTAEHRRARKMMLSTRQQQHNTKIDHGQGAVDSPLEHLFPVDADGGTTQQAGSDDSGLRVCRQQMSSLSVQKEQAEAALEASRRELHLVQQKREQHSATFTKSLRLVAEATINKRAARERQNKASVQ